MRPDLPWNVANIPPEAREAARAAARREGLSVGEWLTRRILHSFIETSPELGAPSRDPWAAEPPRMAEQPRMPDSRMPDSRIPDSRMPDPRMSERAAERPHVRRDTEEMLAHVSRSETESHNAYLKLEEQLRAVANRMDATERHQSENSRAMNKAAAAINVATREQAQAYDQLGGSVRNLTERMERVERQAANDPVKDAVRGLHHGLTRLADQMSQTAETSATQISSLADNLEALAAKVGEARDDAELSFRAIEGRSAAIEQRLLGMENALETHAQTSDSVENALRGLNTRSAAIEQRLLGMETALETHAEAKDSVENALRGLDTRSAAIEQRLLGLEHSIEAQAQTKDEAQLSLRAIEARDEAIEKRLVGVENSLQSQAVDMARVAQNAVAIARLEDGIAGLEAHAADSSLERRLNSVERALGDVVGRLEGPDRRETEFDDRLKGLANRLDASEKSQREFAGELREAVAKLTKAAAQPKRFEPAPFPFNAPFEPSAPIPERPATESPHPFFAEPAPVEPIVPSFAKHEAFETAPPAFTKHEAFEPAPPAFTKHETFDPAPPAFAQRAFEPEPEPEPVFPAHAAAEPDTA
ncbi:MAG: hypothetical protein JOZ55_07825, partial [Alphaproteobacteria bacterium]|nr:hypothetical protein [Alphaproteobacteria bacterium]